MAEWVYVIGEDQYNQSFEAYDDQGRVDLSGFINPRLFIQSTDFSTNYPAGGTAISIDSVNNTFVVPVSVTFMPQIEDMYLSQIRVEDGGGQQRLTFEFDLQVVRSHAS